MLPARSPTRFVVGMSKETTIWLAIFAVGAINYVARLSFIALFARRDMPHPVTPATMFEDAPITVAWDRKEAEQQWTPRNYDNNFRGRISARA